MNDMYFSGRHNFLAHKILFGSLIEFYACKPELRVNLIIISGSKVFKTAVSIGNMSKPFFIKYQVNRFKGDSKVCYHSQRTGPVKLGGIVNEEL